VVFGGPVTVKNRELTIQGTLLPATATIANLDVAMKRLLGWVRSGLLRVVYTSGGGQTLLAEGLYASCEMVPKSDDRPLDRVAADVTLKIRCRESLWRTVEPTMVHLNASGTDRFDLRLRSGPATPVLEAIGTAGLTNPTWTIRRPDGSIYKQIVLAGLNLAAADHYTLDSRSGRGTVYRSGTPTASDNSWSGDFPVTLDNRECYPEAGQYLTATISDGTGRIYYWETDV
jgi:hypothetical protein